MGLADKVAAIIMILAFFVGLSLILRQQVIPVMEQYHSLKSSYERLERDYASLAGNLSSLRQGYRELEERYRGLEENYTALAAERAEERARLEAEISHLRRLLERYQELYSRYWVLVEMAPRVIGSQVRGGEDVQRILRSPPGREVLEAISELGLRGDMDPAEKARKVMEWMAVNIQGLRDDYILVVSNQTATTILEHFQAPNETLKRGGGDCEDLAILAYALLKQALGEGEELYIIAWTTGYLGHAAVLYGSGGRYIIIDPAMNYATNSTIMLSIYFKNATIILTPIALSPSFKEGLLRGGLAEIVYQPEGSRPYALLDLNTTVTLWLSPVKDIVGNVYVDRIINEAIDRRFNSTEEFLAWMAGR